jgi:hypothetical protein
MILRGGLETCRLSQLGQPIFQAMRPEGAHGHRQEAPNGSDLDNKGDWSDALQRLKIALQIQQGLGERRNMPTALLNAAEAVMHLGDPELAARVMGAADASLDRLPIHAMASDRGPTERFRRAIAEQIPSEQLERLRREGAALTLEEAMLRVVAFPPSRS